MRAIVAKSYCEKINESKEKMLGSLPSLGKIKKNSNCLSNILVLHLLSSLAVALNVTQIISLSAKNLVTLSCAA
jgi:hypothetical protein